MIRLVIGLVAITLAGLGAAWMADRPGLVRLDWGGWRLETSVGILLVGLAALLALAIILYRLWRIVRRSPSLLGRWRAESRSRRGERAVVRGLVAIAAGDARDAQKQAREAESLIGAAPLTRLLAAQAAQLSGDPAEAEKQFEALLDDDETAFLGLKGLFAQAQRRGDSAAALVLVERARTLRPDTPWVAGELFQLQVADRKWADAEATLAQAVKRKLVEAADARRRRAVLLLARALELEADGLREEALKRARDAHELAPELAPAAVLTARLLWATDKVRQADGVIEAAWAAAPHPDLASLHAQIHDADGPARKAERLDSLINTNPGHGESRLLLAERALVAGNHAEARAILEPLAAQQPTARALDLLARLERAERGDERAATRWLAQIAEAPPPAQWTCGRCGHVAARWSPDCPACHGFDALGWRVPGAVPEFLPPLLQGSSSAAPTDPGAFAPDALTGSMTARPTPAGPATD